MTRKQNLMVAAAVTTALAATWFFSDSVRAPFSRRGMLSPTEDIPTQHAPAPETLEELRERARAMYQPDQFSEETMAAIISDLNRRAELADAVQDAASARAFIAHVRTQRETTKQILHALRLLLMETESAQSDAVMHTHTREFEQALQTQVEAVQTMYNRVWEADCYGDRSLQDCFDFDSAVVLNIAVMQALGSIDMHRQIDAYHQNQAQDGAEEQTEPSHSGTAHLPATALPEEPEMQAPAPECRFAEAHIKLDWVLAVMRQRTELAYAVQDPTSARCFLELTARGVRATGLASDMLAALNDKQEHDCNSVKAIRSRREEIAEVMAALLKATNDLASRAIQLNYFGSEELRSHYCFSCAEVLHEEIAEQWPPEDGETQGSAEP